MKDLPWKQIVYTIGAFLIGYGGVEMATGYRYVMLHWDWQALIAGLLFTGAYHTPPNQIPVIGAVSKLLQGTTK